jgi:hypothetical protein
MLAKYLCKASIPIHDNAVIPHLSTDLAPTYTKTNENTAKTSRITVQTCFETPTIMANN